MRHPYRPIIDSLYRDERGDLRVLRTGERITHREVMRAIRRALAR